MGKLTKNFLSFYKRATKADIVKVFSYTAMSTFVRMLTGFVSVKVVASIVGPSGVALLGQLNNFSSIAMSISSGGINNGITKYVSEYKDHPSAIKIFLSTALRIIVFCSLITGFLMISFQQFLSNYVMLSPDYNYVFVIFGITILFYALNMMLISILNGYKEFKEYVKVNIVGSIIGLIFSLIFVFSFGLKGALISVVTFQSVIFFITLWMIRKFPWLSWDYFRNILNIKVSKKYFRFTLMTLVTAATVPISQMLLRSYAISNLSAVEAGWWEAMNRLSSVYLMVITSSFSVYYLPRLSEITNRIELQREIYKAYKVIIPVLLCSFTLIYLLRYPIIYILFSPDFLPMNKLFIWQLFGDFFKICSWLLAFLMIAKSMVKIYVLTETVFSFTFVMMGFLFIRENGVVGITQAYLLNYVIYTICMIFIFRKVLYNG